MLTLVLTNPDAALALRRACEHAMELRNALIGAPLSGKPDPSSPLTFGELAGLCEAIGWQCGEACRLLGAEPTPAMRLMMAAASR